MAKLGEMVEKIRSKNAGPFWLTIDIFCGDGETYRSVDSRLSNTMVAGLLQQPEEKLKRFSMPNLNVIKISLPRPHVQGSLLDRDMHGAQWAILLEEFDFD